MEHAQVVALFVASERSGPVTGVNEVEAVADRGLMGDRYHDLNAGEHPAEDEITLIRQEGLEEAEASHGLSLMAGEHRRNVVTRGLDLDDLIGSSVRVGEAEIEVLAHNPPCAYLRDLTGQDVLRGLVREGGVRGRIVTGGRIRVGDRIGS